MQGIREGCRLLTTTPPAARTGTDKDHAMDEHFQKIERELRRLGAQQARVEPDASFEPQAGTLAKVRIHDAYWHLMPHDLVEILQRLDDGAGDDQIHQAIERTGVVIWHGPEPDGSRDRSP